jgi:hypothetical protein
MIGIIVNLELDKHWLFKNYYFSIVNVFGESNVKQVNSIEDLQNVKILFICDEHYYYNKIIWMNPEFINYCNQKNIKVVILNNEKIYNSSYPWNEGIQRNVLRFNNRLQYVYDVEDSKILNSEINKTYMSKTFREQYNFENIEKKDKCIFIGNINSHSYEKRQQFLNEIKDKIDIDILESDENRSMEDYLTTISSYKYVLCPLGNGNFVPMRFYESLFVKSYPLQQSNDDINYFFQSEILNNVGIFFKNIDELINNMPDFQYSEFSGYYMEDFITNSILTKLS